MMELTPKQKKQVVDEYLMDRTPGQLDTLFAEHVGSFFNPHKLFKKTRAVLDESKDGLRSGT